MFGRRRARALREERRETVDAVRELMDKWTRTALWEAADRLARRSTLVEFDGRLGTIELDGVPRVGDAVTVMTGTDWPPARDYAVREVVWMDGGGCRVLLGLPAAVMA